MKTRRQLTAPPKREPVDSAMTGMRAQWESGLETLSGIRQWKLRLQLAGRTASNHKPDQPNGTEKLEKLITVRKRHYVWSEARFVRAMMPFQSNVRVGYDGKEVDGKNVLDLMTLSPPEGSTVRVRAEGPDAAEAMHALEQLMQSHIGLELGIVAEVTIPERQIL
jgi:phosphocarrier protein HPr